MWVTDLDVDQLLKGISPEATADFLDCWINDLKIIKEFENKADAIEVANAYLKYFGSVQHVVNIDWDKKNNVFMWNLKSNMR